MAGDLNSIQIIGRLTKPVEMRNAGSSQVAHISIAVNRIYNKVEEVSFFDVVVWGKLAEVCDQYLSKGSRIAIEGRLQQRRWEQDGNKRSKVEIVANNVQFLDNKSNGSNNPISSDDCPF